MTPKTTHAKAAELLDALPYGVLALSDTGEILHANATAGQIVPAIATAQVSSCHDLFSCKAPGGPCERGCFVARTAGSTKASPEIRIDTAGGVAPGALWATAAPLPGGHGAMLHLRPGWRGDRRRRSENRWQTGPELRIRALGRTHVESLEDSFDGEWLRQRPGQILKYLICERTRTVLVDEIAEAIWPEAGRRAVNNTRFAIHRLRAKLEPRRAAHDRLSFVLSRGSGYTLDRDRIWIDADEFERAIDEGRAAMARLDPDSATQHLERADSLYGGAFLADEPYAHWAIDERNRLAGMAIYGLRVLTALARERGDDDGAIRHLQRLAELEPLDSAVHRELIQALMIAGLRSDAKRRFDSFAHRLRRELDEEPDFDMRTLATEPVSPAP